MKIHINAWHDLASPGAGGSEVVIDRVATELTRRGHDLTLSVPRPVGDHPYRTVVSGGFYTQFLRSPFNYFRRARDADVVIDVINGLPFFTPLWRRHRRTIGFVHHVHDEQWKDSYSGVVAFIGRFLELRVMPRLYREFITVSRSTAEDLERHGARPGSITIVPNGLDPAPGDLPGQDGELLFVMVARLVPNKRVSLLLEMWREVQKTTGGRLVIIGDGPKREFLQGLRVPNCEFLGQIHEHDRDSYLSRSAMLLVTSRREGWGLTILEAARVGTPTLAFNVAGVRDAIVNDSTGVLVNNVDEFQQQWIELAADPELRRRLGEAAEQRAALFSWSHSADLLEAVLERD
jgi:glycosyltransferase involved in cell wall biosynthesis